LILIAGSGCAASEGQDPATLSTSKPHLLALSTYSASLGTPIDAYIANPAPSTTTKMELVFAGTFTHTDGRKEPVNMAQDVTATAAGSVRWTSFGPFANPFTKIPDVGAFSGTIALRTTGADGTQTLDDNPLLVRFEVKPSVILTDLQPTTASCSKPALRLIGAMPYKLKALAVGFKPTTIEYSFTIPSIVPDDQGQPSVDLAPDGTPQTRVTRILHTMTSDTDAIDGNEVVVLPPVPADVPSYGVVFSVVARDDAGHQATSAFGMTAHRPLEVFYDGRFQLAQIYPATPVSACVPGGQQGRTVGYSEANTESRSRTLSVTMSKSLTKSDENNWSTSDGKTITTSSTATDNYSRTHGNTNTFNFDVNHTDQTGVNFHWNDTNTQTNGWVAGGNAGVNFKLFGLDAKAEGKYEQNGSTSSAKSNGQDNYSNTSDGWNQGVSNATNDSTTADHSEATTDSTAVTNTNTNGGSQSVQNGTSDSQNDVWTVSSSDTIGRTFTGQVIANTYGAFYRQLARYTRRAFVLEYDKCGESDVVGDLTMEDYVWAPDLALSDKCPPLPQSNFPPPQCFVPPCDP
jgi:hypothetical protein